MNPARDHAGIAFGKYNLIAKLATGGMGEIFLARQKGMAGFEKLVVIKRLLPHLAEDRNFVAMLFDEAKIAAKLTHPNVCQVHELGEVDGVFYIAMEYLAGVSCAEILNKARLENKWLDFRVVAAVMVQACEGLHNAHELCDRTGKPYGLVHRDVSPSNVFATTDGLVKVLDFGVAKSRNTEARTNTGALKGKYAYMSPEQLNAEELDRRSDIFSMGAVLWELLTSKRLFWRESDFKIFQAIAEDDIPDPRPLRPGLPDSLVHVINRALSRDRDERFSTTLEMAEAIRAAVLPLGGVPSNGTLGAYIRDRFAVVLAERERIVNDAIAGEEDADSVNTVINATVMKRRSELDLPALDDSIPEDDATRASPAGKLQVITGKPAPRRRAGARRLWPWVTTSIVTVAAAAAVLWTWQEGQKKAPPGDDEIVIRYDRASAEQGVAGEAKAPAVATVSKTMAPGAETVATPGEGSRADGATAEKRRPKSVEREQTPRNEIDRVMAGRRGPLRLCAQQHAEILGDTRRVDLAFTVGESGRPTKVTLSRGLTGTPYGRCVASVLKGTEFRNSAGVRVSIPLKFRRK